MPDKPRRRTTRQVATQDTPILPQEDTEVAMQVTQAELTAGEVATQASPSLGKDACAAQRRKPTSRKLFLPARLSSEPCRLRSRPGPLRPGSGSLSRVRPSPSPCPSLRATSLLLGPWCCSS